MALPGLLACLAFIAYMWTRDARRRTRLSWAVWLPTCFLLIVGSRPLSLWVGGRTWTGEGLANSAEGSPVDQVFFFLMIIGALVLATMRGVNWARFISSNLALIAFYLYFAVSILWSEDPSGSSKRLFKDFGLLFVIAAMFSEKNPLQAVRAVYVRCAIFLLPLSAVFIKWYPNIARSFAINGDIMYSGVTTQKNTLGEIVLVFGLFTVWDMLETPGGIWSWRRFPWDRALLLVIGFWLLEMCQSKTALLCLFMGTALMVRSGWFASRVFSWMALGGALCLPYIMFFAQQFSSVLAPVVSAVGRNMTFTGRTEIWEHINSTTVNPLIGAGYWNFWGGSKALKINEIMHSTIPNAHNGYVDLYLDGGMIGLGLLLVLLISNGRRLMKGLQSSRFQRLRFAMLVVAIVYNMSESNWVRMSPIWFTTLLVLSDFPYLKSNLGKKPAPLAPEKDEDLVPFAGAGVEEWSDAAPLGSGPLPASS